MKYSIRHENDMFYINIIGGIYNGMVVTIYCHDGHGMIDLLNKCKELEEKGYKQVIYKEL